HSGSSICRVRMRFAARPFLIEVSDEGRGFVDSGAAGYGLMGMRERAAGIGGRLEVVSTEGRGTTVFLFGPNGGSTRSQAVSPALHLDDWEHEVVRRDRPQ